MRLLFAATHSLCMCTSCLKDVFVPNEWSYLQYINMFNYEQV